MCVAIAATLDERSRFDRAAARRWVREHFDVRRTAAEVAAVHRTALEGVF
jgi:hypothetical protein